MRPIRAQLTSAVHWPGQPLQAAGIHQADAGQQRPVRRVGEFEKNGPAFAVCIQGKQLDSSTVSKLSFIYVQWSQAVTLFPVIETCKFVAL